MKLTDQEYYLLTLLFEHSPENDRGKVKDIVHSIVDPDDQKFVQKILDNKNISELDCIDTMKVNSIAINSLKDESDNRLLIFSYVGHSIGEGLYSVLNMKEHHLAQAMEFTNKSRGSQTCIISGLSVGGAYALCIAAHVGDMSSIVFNAPGIGKVLSDDQKQNLVNSINFITPNQLYSSIGDHPEQVMFAKQTNTIKDPYMFDASGKLIIEEENEAYSLITQIQQTIENETKLMSGIIEIFGETNSIQQDVINDPIYTLLDIMEKMETSNIEQMIPKIERLFEQMANQLVRTWKKDVQIYWKSDDYGDPEKSIQMNDKISEMMDCTMQQIVRLAEEIYSCVEAVFSLLALYHVEKQDLFTNLEFCLDQCIEGIKSKTNDIFDRMIIFLEKEFNKQMDSLFLSLNLHLDIV